jgi:hypothetical protein
MRKSRLPVVLALLAISSLSQVACERNRKLKVTEIGANRVEILLDEPFSNQLNLTNMKFRWTAKEPNAQATSGEVPLDIVGSLSGGTFLVIYEDAGYNGPPVSQPFHNSPGIKVENGFFPGYGNNPGVSMQVDGTNSGTAVLFVPATDTVNDVVRFGPTPRPPLAGSFREDGSLTGEKPRGTESVSRQFSANGPVDTDSETDWARKPESIGVPNP